MKTVLLLDDDRDLRALLRAALVARGLQVFEAGTAREAQDALAWRWVDLAVVDGFLPDDSGVEFIARLRASNRRIRIVFVSAFYRQLETFHRLTTELDVSLVVYKPINPSSFADRVAAILEPPVPPPEAQPATTDPGLELAALARDYAERLPGKVAELKGAIEQARSDVSAIGAARMLAHRLCGTAGSYGFSAVGELMGQIEDLLIAVGGTDPVRRFVWDDIDGLLHDVARIAVRGPSDSPSDPEVVAGSRRALLVVDDDPDFLQVVRALGRRLLVNVVACQRLEEALERARAQPFVAALLDVHLEGCDSFRAAQQIRDSGDNADIPVAFASVDGRLETRVAAIEAGGCRFFDKPISEERLAELFQHFLSLSKQQEPRVLIVDDDPDVLATYTRVLSDADFATEHLDSAEALVPTLEELRPDVLILDVNLPRVSGIDVCRALRNSDRWELLPILIVTAQLDVDTRLRAFRAGASDVVGKPILPEELLARVGVQVERLRLVRERADRDFLSGLLLRRAFLEAFQRALAVCSREKKPLALVLFDLDHFKSINDGHGHACGDRVIAGFGEFLRRRFRIEDVRGRWGGEEFALVLPGVGAELAVQSARRMLAEFAAHEFKSDTGESFRVTFTAGVAEYPDDGTSMSVLIRNADELLYSGKRAGRNTIYGRTARVESGRRQ